MMINKNLCFKKNKKIFFVDFLVDICLNIDLRRTKRNKKLAICYKIAFNTIKYTFFVVF